MTETKFINERIVLFIDLPQGTKNDRELFENSVKAGLEYYTKVYGSPRRIWVNSKDTPDEVEHVNGILIEKRGGCARGKLMVMG